MSKLNNARTITIQYSFKRKNPEDETIMSAFHFRAEYGNKTRVNSVLAKGWVECGDGWMNVDKSWIALPDMTDVASSWIRTQADRFDYFLDNVIVIIENWQCFNKD